MTEEPFDLIDTKGELGGNVHLKYGAKDESLPFILIVTPQYVARETGKRIPISFQEIQAFVAENAADLKMTAQRVKARGENTFELV